MKKLGFIIAFCSLFVLGLSAQAPNVKGKAGKTPAAKAAQGPNRKCISQKVASKPVALPTNRKAVRAPQTKMRPVEKPKQN